ncbi:hypothetical protein RLPCCGM1_c0772 [Rhizobium leguminosarum bv. phaseoli CCGM1]|nr:hypothetical protein RLPCCGM1_c0772 [Rhizobium leguminosarum bv. phaseoli CCGM1]
MTVEYSGFGPANQDKIWAKCAKCGEQLQRFKCFDVTVELVPDAGGSET